MPDQRTPELSAEAQAQRKREIAEREALIAAKAQADDDAQAWDGPLTLRHEIHRADQAENDPYSIHYGGCRYMVLDLDHDPLARIAAEAYAAACEQSHPEFAADLRAVISGAR